MNSIFEFVLYTIISMCILYFIYFFLFKNDNNYSLQRFYLLFSLLFSITIPLIPYTIFALKITSNLNVNFEMDEIIPLYKQPNQEPVASVNFGIVQISGIIYLTGALVALLRMAKSICNIISLINNKSVLYGKLKLIYLQSANVPFSFFNYIFINNQLYSPEELEALICHEKEHKINRHSIDRIFLEILIVVFWFNPFIYLFKKALIVVHEYEADSGVLSSGINKSVYLDLFLKHASSAIQNQLISSFNSQIKKRIIMINISYKKSRIKYLVILPVTAILIILFSFKNVNNIPNTAPIKKTSETKITLSFGKEFKNPFLKKTIIHQGVDIKAAAGTPVYAAADATVFETGSSEGRGNYIILIHSEEYQTLYSHLNDILVEKDQNIKAGSKIGTVGNTGYSTGPHLHYEVKENGKNVNPENYFTW